MVDFIDQPEAEKSEFIGPPDTTPRVDESLTEQLVEYYSTALNRSPEKVALEIDSGSYSMLRADAGYKADEGVRNQFNQAVEQVLIDQPENPQEALGNAREQMVFGNYIAPDVAALLNDGSDMSAFERRVVERSYAAQRIVEQKRSLSAKGFGAGIGYWIDAAFSDIIQAPLGALSELTGIGEDVFEGGGQLNELALEASQLLHQDVSEEEFERRFSDILDRVADAGMFSDENPFYLESFLENARQGGVGWESEMNRIFQVLDVVSLGVANLAGNTGSVVRSMSRVGTIDEAAAIAIRKGDALEDTPILTEGTSTKILTVADPDRDFFSAPELTVMRELEANNAALEAIKKYNSGSFVSDDILEARRDGWVKDIRERNGKYKRREIDYDIRVGPSGNILGSAVMGVRGGKPFKSITAAEKFANSVGGEVIPQVVEGKAQWVVRKEWDIPTVGLADPTDLKQVATSFLSTIMSTTARTSVNLDSMLKRGEAQVAKTMRELGRSYKSALRKVSKDETRLVDQMLDSLLNDPLENWRREPLTNQEFATRWSSKHGSPPSDSVVDYHASVRDISDVDYFLNADILLKEAINSKETMVRLNGQYYRSRLVTDIDADDAVYNMDTNRLVKYSDLDPERARVYEVKDFAFEPQGVGKVQYVVGEMPTRRMYHTDVLGYNAGGHRKYTDVLKFYMKQDGRKITLAGGKQFDGSPSTFMAVRTEAEARIAMTEWNNIARAVREGLPLKEVNATIARNNSWNTSLQDVTDLHEFVEDFGLRATDDINFAGDGEPIVGQAFAGANTLGDTFRAGMGSSKSRGTRPLLGFGGNDLDTLDPTKAIERGFAQSVARNGDQRYLFNAVNGWVKAAEREGALLNANDLVGMSPKAKMENALVSKHTATGKALSTERETIRYRLSNTTAQIAAERNTLRALADFAYGKNSKGIGKALDWMSTKDPAGFIRSIAFHSKLGLFAVDQVYVQASQILNVVGITSATIGAQGAVRGMLAVAPLRMALIEQIPDAALLRLAKIQAPFSGISAEDFVLLRDWVKSTGRNVVDKTIVQENNAAASIVSNRLLEYGQVFFNEGELIARLGAATTNLLERRAKYPGEDIFDSRTTDLMLHRQDVLTASMTSASAAPWQRSLLAIPLQFTTYHVRMMEQIFTKEILTKEERWRLGITHMLAYGTAAVPAAGYLQDRMGYEGAVDPSTGLYDVVRYGALDAVLTALSGEETALSSRLGIGEGLFDLFSRAGEDSIFELAIGPGGTIGWETGVAMKSMVENIFAGQFNHLSYDWNRFARNVTSYNRAYTLWMGQRYGTYTSRKTEDILNGDMSSVDTVLKALGIPLKEDELVWTTIGNTTMDKRHLETTIREINRLDNIASRLMKDGDVDGAAGFMEDIGAMLAILRPGEQDKVLSRLRKTLTIHESVVRNLVKNGNVELANKIQEYIE